MSCTPLSINNGLFIPITWSTEAEQQAGDITITRTTNSTSTNPGITVTGPTGSIFHQTLRNNTSKYLLFGSDHNILILESGTGAGPVSRNVTIIDFTGSQPTENLIFTSTSSSTAVNEPVVHQSKGNGKAFLIWSSSGTEIQNLTIRRSDTGKVICLGPPPFQATGEIQAEANDTHLIIHYSSNSTSKTKECPKPLGKCKVTPSSPTFPDAVVGADNPLASSTLTFTIKNDGNDCMAIDAIDNVEPFFVARTSKTLPASLGKDESMEVDVTFEPSAVGDFGPTDLPITCTPANGDSVLTCKGKGREATIDIGFNATSFNWGKLPVGTMQAETLTIKNTGEKPIEVSLAASSPSSPFQWEEFAEDIPYDSERSITINFRPLSEGALNTTMSVNSGAPSSPHIINFMGEGCIANAAIDVPPSAPIEFGQIQQGFRTVRTITIKNIGDGQLTFKVRIDGSDKTLFGLQPPSGSITDVMLERNYVVDPVSGCGTVTTGSGEAVAAIAFHANAAPAIKNAELIIENHNAINTSTTSWTFPLNAEIIPPVAVDAVQVLDHSGSMGGSNGDRIKSEAEISAGRLFAQLARPDIEDRLALVKFSTVPNLLQTIIDVTSGNQESIASKINATDLAPNGWTSISGGVMMALNELAKPRATEPPKLNKAIVVLTDGIDNRAYQNPEDSKWYSLLGGETMKPDGSTVNTDPLSTPSDVKIYAVGIGNEENIDKGSLNALSQETGAYYGIVGTLTGQSYFALEKYFTQIYMDAVNMATIKDPIYTILPGKQHEIGFDLLRGDIGALVVIYDHKGMCLPFYLKSPLGELIDLNTAPSGFQVRPGSTNTARFIEFRVPQGEPDRYSGRWNVVVEHNHEVCFSHRQQNSDSSGVPAHGTFLMEKCRSWDKPVDYGVAIGAGSNFKMHVLVSPGIIHTGEPILLTAIITEAALPVTGCTVTVHVISPSGATWALTLLDDGTHNDATTNDGEYARQFAHTAEAGSYEFTFRAVGFTHDNEPVVREAVRAKYVEGRKPIKPNKTDIQQPNLTLDKCCQRIIPLLSGILLLLLIIVLLWVLSS